MPNIQDQSASRKRRKIAWVDGVPSVVMAFLERRVDPSVTPVHCDLGDSVHIDSRRFIEDAQAWYGTEIVRIRSSEYANIDEVFEKRKYHAGIAGAPCTGEMKFAPRLDYQLPSDIHLWGYTADKRDVTRFGRMLASYPEMHQRAPLIEQGITRSMCFAILREAGLRAPWVYSIGYPNGNCPGCVKASSPDYWDMTREHFPEVFARRAEQSRRFGSRLVRVKGGRVFLDELPKDWKRKPVKIEPCDFLCTLDAKDFTA